MTELGFLSDILILLTVSILNVVLSRRLTLSPVLGYLVLGAIIGEHGFNLINEPSYAHNISEFGVVFLLFAIGLELTFERLIYMRWLVFGFGGAQVVLSSVAFGVLLHQMLGLTMSTAIFVGCALALSSTAIVMQVLYENKRQSTQVGRLSLAVLLMQDFAVVPLLAILPIMSTVANNQELLNVLGFSALKAFVAIIMITIAGRLLLRPFFSVIGSAKSDEVYVSTTLLIVLGAALLTSQLGLSTAMGAFIAGILIAETEYRNRVEMSIMPFKSLLLGLFFLSVGMSINFQYILDNLKYVFMGAVVLLGVKALIVLILCKPFKIRLGAAIHSALLLSQGGEFAFILFSMAAAQKVLEPQTAQLLLVIVAVTMAVTPLLSFLGAKLEDKIDSEEELDKNQEFKGVSDLDSHIIISGFGRVGRVIAYMLSELQFNYIAVDSNLMLVKKARALGFPVYHGDLSDLDVLRSVGAERARCVILTMSDRESIRKSIKTIYTNYRDLDIICRAEDFKHGKNLKKLGADVYVPSTIETGLQLGGSLLSTLGVVEHDILDLKALFRRNDYSFTEEIELFSGITPSKKIDHE
ncbi:MAG: monovalent cation:proton antiporter-2 (CPA2) family protein [Alphaproteobacteria bacterium]|jgi:CPA2 family monovalent cation:H+ antiporter-2|nr:monovalent cation:proton antiporter-2 (CPA2) family protein [Candidatus Jidaibacter sp.]